MVYRKAAKKKEIDTFSKWRAMNRGVDKETRKKIK
jgi:hypothetical protein